MAKTHAQTLHEINVTLDQIMDLRTEILNTAREDIDWKLISAEIDICAQLGTDIITFFINNNLRLGPNIKRDDKQEASKPATRQKVAVPKPTVAHPKRPSDVLKKAHAKPVAKKAPVKAAPRKR